MRISILVEGKTEKAFKPFPITYLQTRLPGKMPKLDMAKPCDGAAGAAAVWQNNAGPVTRGRGFRQLLRPRRPSERGQVGRAQYCTATAQGTRGHRWFENLSKRQVKAPKVFVRDSGLLHALLGIASQRDLELHPKVGASWESYAVEEVLKALQPDKAYFWATH